MGPDLRSQFLPSSSFCDTVRPLWKSFSPREIKRRSKRSGGSPADLPITILSLENFPNCPETVEDKDTFEGNAIKKAVEVCQCTGKPALADDSGLEVDALGGAPGVYSARYAGGAGNGNDVRNYEKLLSELKNVPDEKRGAQFVCCMALAFPDGTVKTFFGYAKGRIGMEPKGKTGFGYDPVFIPERLRKDFCRDVRRREGQAQSQG